MNLRSKRRSRARADALLFERGLAESRSKAQALILAGSVYTADRRIDKPGALLELTAPLTVRRAPRYVSRGGDKLDGALADLDVDLTGAVCVDVGAATGGFTDCLLQHGASKVYAVDVGRAQLAAKLRADRRVTVMERTNARYLSAQRFDQPIDVVVVDASFIGLDKLMPAIAALLRPQGRLLALVKPQFEAGRDAARRAGGVIRDPVVREAAIAGARNPITAHGFELLGECDSRLAGPKGNVEHFVLARRV